MGSGTKNPYVGPRAFIEGETLYGRDREIEKLVNLLIARRIILLHSPSGAGKTSLIQAALIPQLRNEGFRVLPIIRVGHAIEFEAKTTNRYIYTTLNTLNEQLPATQQVPIDTLATLCIRDYFTLYDANTCRAEPPLETVLIFDQFEELLTTDPINREAKDVFLEQLGSLLQKEQYWALFAIREDFLGPLKTHLHLIPTHLETTFRLDLLHVDAACDAMQKPVHEVGITFTDEAAQQLANDLRRTVTQLPDGTSETTVGSFIEPVHLQVVCYQLWSRIFGTRQPPAKTMIDHHDLEQSGDVNTALASYYNEEIYKIVVQTGENERAIRDWFEQQLITPDRLRGQVQRRQGKSGDLANHIIQLLINAHLVRADERRGIIWYELTHDRFVEPILESNTSWKQTNLTLFQHQTILWINQGEPEAGLLSGQALADAEAWIQHMTPTAEEQAFLHASQRRRHQQLMRQMITGVGVISLVAVGVLIFLLWQTSSELHSAKSYRVATEVNNLVAAGITERGLLLAMETFGSNKNPTTWHALNYALDARHFDVTTFNESAGGVTQATFTPHGALLTLAGEAPSITVHLWSTAGQLLQTPDLIAPVQFATLSGDGSRVLTVSDQHQARLWNDKLQQVATFSLDRPLKYASFTNDGSYVLTILDNNHVQLRDTKGVIINVYTDLGFVKGAILSPDGSRILTFSDTMARLWDINHQRTFDPLRGHTGNINTATFSPDGKRILTASDDQTVRIWDDMGNPLAVLKGHTDAINSAVFSPDGTRIVSASSDNTVRIWNADGTLLHILQGHADNIWSATFDINGERVLTTAADRTMRLWTPSPPLLPTFIGHSAEVYSADASPDGSHIVTASGDQTALVWTDRGTTPVSVTLRGHQNIILDVLFTPDGLHILTASNDSTAKMWNTDGTLVTEFRGHTGEVNSVRFSPNPAMPAILTASNDTTARLWDLSGGIIATFKGHTRRLESAVFSPKGDAILTASQDGSARLWDLNGLELAYLKHDGAVRSALFSPSGKFILTASNDRTAKLWDARGQLLRTFEGHSDTVYRAVFNRDETFILTASADDTARLWAINSTTVTTLQGHTDDVVRAIFSPDGMSIVTGSKDATTRLWDAQGYLLNIFQGHTAAVNSIVFINKGSRILTTSDDGTARLWPIKAEDWLHAASCRVGRSLTDDEIETYGVEIPLSFAYTQRQCPVQFSWIVPPQ